MIATGLWGGFTEVKAAKEHYCKWCKKHRIAKGERHFKYVGKFEGDFQSWRVHPECAAAWEKMYGALGGACCESQHERGAVCGENC